MNRDARNRMGLVTLTGVLAAAVVVALLWLAAPAQVTLADDPPEISGEDAVNQGPTSQIWSPVRDAIIRETGVLTISGYAWEEGVEPPFLAEVPEVSVQRIGDMSYYVGWTTVISAESYIVRESETADFSTYVELPPVDASDPDYVSITKESGEEGTYYYRVRATRFGMDPSRWSNVASVEVPWTETTQSDTGSGIEIAAVANGTFTVEVRIDGGEWYTAPVTSEGWGGWSWAYGWGPLPEEHGVQHVIETRATNGLGEVGAVDAISITVSNEETITYLPLLARRWTAVPRKPTLNAIDNTDMDDSYTVSWAYDPGDPPIMADSFTLQEDTNAGFTSPTDYSVVGSTSRAFSDKGEGIYYYRVRGNNANGPGRWSDVVSTEVKGDFYDSFSDPNSGWITHDIKTGLYGCDTARENLDYKYDLFFENGRYKVFVPLDCRAGGQNGDTRHIYPVLFAPNTTRPVERTCIGMTGGFETWDSYWSFWGIAFAASQDKSTVYSLEVNNLGDWGIIKRTGYQYPGPNHPYQNETRQAVEDDTQYVGGLRWPAKSAFNLNKLEVEVGITKVIFYINDVEAYTIENPYIVNEIRSLRYVGIIGGNWEITPTQIGYENFYVDKGCDDY